jgi:hypothetical protein
VTVKNSTNINKTKESLNSERQQFHQYQQNKESLSSERQQFHQYQQNKLSFVLLILVELLAINV